MDAHKPDALTDSALRRDVESLLTVEPSANFLARVRARVANEPSPMFWSLRRSGVSSDPPFQWAFVGAALAVTIIATAVIWVSFGPARSIDGPAQAPLVAESVTRPAVSNPAGPGAALAPAIEAARRSPNMPRARRDAEVREERDNLIAVVAPEDVKAFADLLASIRQPDVVLVLNEDTTAPAALVAASIEITPIDIEPVPPVAQLEGGVE